ncbi:Glycine oxidase [Roseovarius sp. THAF27]|uniref:NAD(P)/FAD-dependent oxidoreductase n=1 Tax=Roseovarius sp. THAF27 TaxID=2587850 RepID=UPI00126865DE|nr:FAD-dependent oxidoreductase [Roseovarius sp. THAF27]QFT82638.1 Glycine oxidase [Roseovarius sp. THAF27]
MADVTIYGAGIFGLSIAFACQSAGAKVRVIDPGGVGAGASGGVVGALAPHVPENWNDKKAFQLDSLLMAEAFWAEVAEVSGLPPGYARTGRVQPVADEAGFALAQQREVTARELWGDAATWQVVEADTLAHAPVTPTGLLILDTLSARLHPREGARALAAAIVTRGGEIVAEGKPQGRVVHATGVAGLTELSERLAAPVGNGVKGQGAVLDFAAPDAPQVFADALHVIFHRNGTTAVGSTSEREYASATETDAQLDEVLDRARIAVPALRDAKVIERWAGVRPRARSRAPMLGVHPLYPGQFIANGGFKIGFGMAPKVAQVMADLVLDGRDEIPAALRPEASLPKTG